MEDVIRQPVIQCLFAGHTEVWLYPDDNVLHCICLSLLLKEMQVKGFHVTAYCCRSRGSSQSDSVCFLKEQFFIPRMFPSQALS